MRWEEEVTLLREEMRRVRAFLTWHADWWIGQQHRRLDAAEALQEGLEAYARRQAHLRIALREQFARKWLYVEAWVVWGDVPVEPEDEPEDGMMLLKDLEPEDRMTLLNP